MGAGGSKVDDIVAIAKAPDTGYSPPLGTPNPSNPLVEFDIRLGRYGEATPLGKIVIELKEDVTPKTARNFLELCQREAGKGFMNSRFHRIIPGFMCQGGDFTNDNGTGGVSIYGARFPDENFTLKHRGAGILSMANAGPNTNGSQFFLCTAPTAWLDGKHVVFGQVVKGYEVVKAMEACGSRGGDTSQDVMIYRCGVVSGPTASAAPTQQRTPSFQRQLHTAPKWATSSLGGSAAATRSLFSSARSLSAPALAAPVSRAVAAPFCTARLPRTTPKIQGSGLRSCVASFSRAALAVL